MNEFDTLLEKLRNCPDDELRRLVAIEIINDGKEKHQSYEVSLKIVDSDKQSNRVAELYNGYVYADSFVSIYNHEMGVGYGRNDEEGLKELRSIIAYNREFTNRIYDIGLNLINQRLININSK